MHVIDDLELDPPRQRPPTARFGQFCVVAEVGFDDALYDRVDRHIQKSLIENQHILDHVAVRLGLLVTVEVIPFEPLEPCFKGKLHRL